MLINAAYATDADTIEVVSQTQEVPEVSDNDSLQSSLSSLMPFVLIFAVMYFLLIRPQEKRRKELENLVSGVKIGDQIVTNSGIFGKINAINDSDATVTIEIASSVDMKILKSSIADIITKKSEKTLEKKAAKTKK